MPRLEALDLRRLVSQMLSETAQGPEEVGIWGGRFAEEELSAFLGLWKLPRERMPWGIWLWTDKIRFDHRGSAPGDLAYLERGRIFGPEGDLELRRTSEPGGEQFLWRFVGEPGTPQQVGFDAVNYWDRSGNKLVRAYERVALLWGSKQAAGQLGKGGRHDDRVGKAQLDYPHVQGNRIQVRYVEYLYGGNVELARLLGVENAPG